MRGRWLVVGALAVVMGCLGVSTTASSAPSVAGSWSPVFQSSGTRNVTSGVVALSGTDAYAAGSHVIESEDGDSRPLILRWNGHTWSRWAPVSGARIRRRGNGAHSEGIASIAATSDSNVWILEGIGYEESSGIARWNGRRWIRITLRGLPGSQTLGDGYHVHTIDGHLLVTTKHTWIVGYDPFSNHPFVARYVTDKHPHWVSTRVHHVGRFTAATVRGASDAWAAGSVTKPHSNPNPNWYNGRALIEHFVAGSWHRTATPAQPMFVSGIAADSASDAMAVGNASVYGSASPLTVQWTGKAWTSVAFPYSATRLTAISSAGHGTYWAAGTESNNPTNATYFYYNGSSWTSVPGPSHTAHRTPTYTTVTGITRVPDTSTELSLGYTGITACGDEGTDCGATVIDTTSQRTVPERHLWSRVPG